MVRVMMQPAAKMRVSTRLRCSTQRRMEDETPMLLAKSTALRWAPCGVSQSVTRVHRRREGWSLAEEGRMGAGRGMRRGPALPMLITCDRSLPLHLFAVPQLRRGDSPGHT